MAVAVFRWQWDILAQNTEPCILESNSWEKLGGRDSLSLKMNEKNYQKEIFKFRNRLDLRDKVVLTKVF